MAASVVHIPLAPMTLEINAAQSEYVTWVVSGPLRLLPVALRLTGIAF